jgi:hypothetical protein
MAAKKEKEKGSVPHNRICRPRRWQEYICKMRDLGATSLRGKAELNRVVVGAFVPGNTFRMRIDFERHQLTVSKIQD